MEEENNNCRKRGRPPGKKVKLSVNNKTPSTPDGSSTDISICNTIYGFREHMMRICAFFAHINPKPPRDVDLNIVARASRSILKRLAFSFRNLTWSITIEGKTVRGSSLDETRKVNVLHDVLHLDIFTAEETIVGNLDYWFSMDQHTYTLCKYESRIIAVTKYENKYYVYDPSNFNYTINSGPTCSLTECYDTTQLAQTIIQRMWHEDVPSCTLSCHLIAINVSSPTSSTVTHITRRENTRKKNEAPDDEIHLCTKKRKPCVQDLSSDNLVTLEATCDPTDKHSDVFLLVCCFFSLIDAEKPTTLRLDQVVRTSQHLFKTNADVTIKNFDFFETTYEGRRILIYKILGLNKLNGELYDTLKFIMWCDKMYLVNNLRHWFAMGNNEKTVLECYYKVYGILHVDNKYFLFDPNDCLVKNNAILNNKKTLTFSEHDTIKQLVDALNESFNNETIFPSSFTCTLFAVDTIIPIDDSDLYITSDPVLFERSAKANAIRNIKTLVSEENEFRAVKLREKMAKFKQNMTEAAKEKAIQQLEQYKMRQWKNMSATEREEALKTLKEASEKIRSDMTEAAKQKDLTRLHQRIKENMSADDVEENRRKMREYKSQKVSTMNADERAEYRKKNREYEAKRRSVMTTQQKKSNKLKAKVRYANNSKEIAQRFELTSSIKKHLQFEGKKGIVKDNVVAALGGRPEDNIEAETLVNTNLQYRTDLLAKHSKALVTLVYSLKHRKAMSDAEDNIDDKIVTMLGTSLHTIHTEAYFPDTTYSSMSDVDYEVNEDGLLLHSSRNANGPTSWYCDDRCDVDAAVIYNRFCNIIDVVLQSTESELFQFLHNVDNCDNRAIADVERLGHPKECYIHSDNHYGCSSVLLFLRSVSPHYPFFRNVVSKVYKVRGDLKRIKEIDTAIANVNVAELRRISDELKSKSADTFVPSAGWPYASETEIVNRYSVAFTALQRQCADLPATVCISCMELCYKRNVRHIQDFYPHNNIRDKWDDLLDVHEQHNYKHGKYICSYCFDKFSRQRTLPPTCLLYNMQVREPPSCIMHLNDYEQMLIQRAKAFQVVTRMGAVAKKNRPRQEMIQKVVGRTFHLPLPLEQTLKKMPTPEQAIAPNQDVYILVRGLPSKQKQVFQSYVNVTHVYEALKWLKTNNHLYNEIRLPQLAENVLDELDDANDVQFDLNNILTQTDESSSVPPAMITQKDVGDSFYEHVTLHSIGGEQPNEQPSTVYQFKKVFDKPIDNREKTLDLKCFPHLFPYGENGQFADREETLPLRQFMKNRMKSVYSQFRLNIQYLFFLLSIVNMRQIAASVYTAMNVTPQLKNMTAKLLREKLAKNEFDKNASNVFNSLRNSKAFWNKPRNDINCMVKYYGPATWFLTISPSEYHWTDLENYLRQINGEKAVGKTASALIAMDPVSTSRFIDNKFKAMLDFICAKDGPLGEVEHYAWRREYQSRGLQHFHLMIWIKEAPILGTSSNDEVADFIAKHATCKLPDKINFATLYSRVMLYQQHHHNTYCMRTKKNKSGRYIKRCRFDFSRPSVTTSITLRDVATSIHGRRKLKLKSRLYDLQRTEAEVNINDYNPAILMAWEGNMDIQFIGEKSGALCAYITKYNTKPEKSFAGDGFSDIAATKPLYSKLWLMGQRILTHRECGTLEAADSLLQIPLFGTDKNTTIKWLDVRQVRNGKLREWRNVEALSDDSTDVFWPSLIDTHYPNRPAALEDLCLYDFASKYEIVKSKPLRSDEFHAYGKLYVKRRKRNLLINHYNYNLENDIEKYFYALLLLYKPFRKEEELLGSFQTFAESFDNCKDELIAALQYHEKMQEIAQAKKALDERVKEMEDASQAADDESICGSLNGLRIDDAVNDIQPCLGINNISQEELSRMVNSLNADQSRVFNHVTSALLHQRSEDETNSVLRQFVSGVGGTGKSHLIHVLRQWVKNELSADVIVAAPTGIAAQNVKGLTIHRFLKLPVEHGTTPEYKELNNVSLQQLRNELLNVKLIIIDEVSMVSNVVLLFIHLRLQEIFNTSQKEDGWFGGKNILLFGDLLQLTPVNADSPFVTLTPAQLSKITNALPTAINLWSDLFTYDELTINVRQQSDRNFARILSHIRLGIMDEKDQEELEGRLMHFTFGNTQEGYLQELVAQVQSLPPTCVCLFATKKQCNAFNNSMVSLLTGAYIVLKAKDDIDGRSQKLKFNLKTKSTC